MLHGNGQIDVKLISRLECSGNKVVVYYSRMEGGIERHSSFYPADKVATPAGTFDCTKVKYKIKSRSPKETIEGYGYEWYAPNVGVVKNEQYNNNNQLQYYTVLEVVK